MVVESSENIRKMIKRKYNKDPGEWRVLTSRGTDGYANTLVIHGSEAWLLKEEFVNPYNTIGVGSKTDAESKDFEALLGNPYTYGFRPLEKDYLDDMLRESVSRNFVQKVLRTKPVPFNRIDSPMVLEGPIVSSAKPLSFSESQRKLDQKLGVNLKKLLRRKHPDLLRIYG